MYCSGFS